MPLTLTRRFWAYVGLVAVSFLPAVFLNSIFGYLPALFLLFSGAVSMGYLLLLRRGVECAVGADTQACHRGTGGSFTIAMQNRSHLVLTKGKALIFTEDSSGRDQTTTEAVFSMGKEPMQQLEFGVTFAHIGVYRAGVRRMELYDPLGLFMSRADTAESAFSVLVLPKTVDLSQFNLHEKNRVETVARPTRTIEGEGMDYSSVREYVAGDPIKQIHWKLSAHTDAYMTKVMELQTNTGLSIVVDSTVPAYAPEEMLGVFDCVVETALSLARYARARGMDCDLLYLDQAGSVHKQIPHANSAGEELVRTVGPILQDEDSKKMIEMLEYLEGQAYSQSNVILCTGSPTQALVQKTLSLRQNDRHPAVLIAHPEQHRDREERDRPFANARSMLETAQIPTMLLTDVTELL